MPVGFPASGPKSERVSLSLPLMEDGNEEKEEEGGEEEEKEEEEGLDAVGGGSKLARKTPSLRCTLWLPPARTAHCALDPFCPCLHASCSWVLLSSRTPSSLLRFPHGHAS